MKSRNLCSPHGWPGLVADGWFTPPKRRFVKAERTFPNAFPREALFNCVSTRFDTNRLKIYPPPNEDFGRPNKPFRVRFRTTCQGCEYLIWATNRRQVVRKRTLKGLFGLPKSSFGEHKIASKTHSERLVRPSKIFVQVA